MRVLIGHECSGIIREAFKARGHDAWSCDLKPSEIIGNHLQCDVLEALKYGWDLFICHPPCTFNSNSSAGWRYHPEDTYLSKHLRRPHPLYPNRKEDQQKAIEHFKACLNCGVKKICAENPIPLKSLIYQAGNYSQKIQPYYFGDPFSKSTCLWLRGLPRLKPTNIVDKGEFIKFPSGKTMPKWYSDARKINKETTQTLRSKTFPGIALAMAEQWG